MGEKLFTLYIQRGCTSSSWCLLFWFYVFLAQKSLFFVGLFSKMLTVTENYGQNSARSFTLPSRG